MQKRKAGTWLSIQVAIIVISILSATVFFYAKNIVVNKRNILIKKECILIATQVLDTLKYNERYNENVDYPNGKITRNGEKYEVSINEEHITVEGIKMKKISCEIANKNATPFTLSTYIGVKNETT